MRAERAGRNWVGPDTPYSRSQSYSEVPLVSGNLLPADESRRLERGDGRAASGATRPGLCMPGEFRSHHPSKTAPSCSMKRASIAPSGWYNHGKAVRWINSAPCSRRREQCAELIQRTALPWLYHPDGIMLARFIEQDGAVLEG